MSARERFEAWFRAHEGGSYAPGTGNYNWNRGLAMDAWQAARAEALEEAAEVCDEAARRCKSNSMAVSSTHARDNWLSEADSHIVNADAIRALKDKEPA